MLRVQARGDPRAFALLVERWEEPIRRLCTRMTGDAHRGEDLTQETFARLFDKRRIYKPTARFSTYLWRIALNLCHDELRRVKRSGNPQADGEVAALRPATREEEMPDARAVKEEEAAAVRQAVLRLPEIYRTALILRHYEDLRIREVAEILEVPEGTVNSRLAEGLARLARLLEPRFGEARNPESKETQRRSPREGLAV